MRQNYQTGGISMSNTMAQNRAINNARRAAANTELEAPRNRILQRMQQNQANQFDFGKHAQVSEAMAGKTGQEVIPEYGMQTGYDFQEKSNMNPIASSILASGYQLGQEGLRALNPMGDNFLNFKKAYETANQQAGENIEGILTADTGTISAEQQANRNKYLESVGQQPDAATPTYDSSAGAIITDGDSKYKINADGSRTLIGKLGEATPTPDAGTNLTPLNAPLNRDDFNKFFSTGNSKDYENYLSNFSKEQKVANKNNELYYGPNQKPTMADVAGPSEVDTFKTSNPGMEFGTGAGTLNIDGTLVQVGIDKATGFPSYLPLDEAKAIGITPNTNLASGGRVGQNMGGLMRLNYMIGGEAKQMEAGAPPIIYEGNMDPNAQAGLPSVPGPMQMAEDGPEFDMRENGGFQPLGRQEGKDDVPAMLAKNEFVMTADAVRAAGGGSIQKGAQKMYDTMKKLESRVS